MEQYKCNHLMGMGNACHQTDRKEIYNEIEED
jgi:hypothetical protein